MRAKGKSWLSLAGCLAGMTCLLGAGEFAPPAEGPVPFRRDRMPLEADAMVALAGQLESLAGGLKAKDGRDRRGAAQMLALALALDPGNAGARHMIKAYAMDRHVPSGDAQRLEKIRSDIRRWITWLETEEAGPDGQALAACLRDVMGISEGRALVAAEQGAWTGWIPDVSAYKKKPGGREEKPKEPEPKVQEVVNHAVLLEQAEVQTPLWFFDKRIDPPVWTLTSGPLQMKATKAHGDEQGRSPFSIVIGSGQDRGTLDQLGDSIKVLLEKQHGTLPPGVRMQITSKPFEDSLKSKQRQSISAAVAVLAGSALSGREPQAIIIGQVDQSGAFGLSSRFWYQLQALGKGSGQRLVLPVEAEPYLSSILAMERPEFFIEYEVVLASDFQQLLAFSAKVPDEPLASASAKFQEIRNKMGTSDLRTYIGHSSVKQRLAQVLQDLPSHVSAKMLLIQASGNRPFWVSRKVLAAELRRSIEPMEWLLTVNSFGQGSKEAARLGETYDSCRTKVDGLERYAEKSDRELVEQARELAVALRSLDKAARSRGEGYVVMVAMQNARENLMRLHKELIQRLVGEVGDEPAERQD